jgi:hypothetical protein
MDYPNKCDKCSKEHCEKDCPAMRKMIAMDTSQVLKWAKEHSKLHNQIQDKFRIFSIKCKHAGMIINEILPHPGRCFHSNASPYDPGFTNCSMMRCPLLNLNHH